MPNEIQTKLDAEAGFTITLASLGSVGNSRASLAISNANQRPSALIYLGLKSNGSAPNAGAIYEVYLLRRDTTATIIGTDGWDGTDSAITIENAPLIGSIVVTATANKVFFGMFDTEPLGKLGPEWGIAIKNSSGQDLNATEGDHTKRHIDYLPEIQ